MRVLVTGGSGFLGSAVVPALLRAGHEVRCLLRSSSDTRRIDGLSWERAEGDVRDAESVRRAMAGCGAVVHMASVSAWDQIDSPLMGEVVQGGTRNILEAALAQSGVRVVFVSSILAINGSERPEVFSESGSWTLSDRNLHYSNAKMAAESLCREYVKRGVPVVVASPGEIYGPRDTAMITAGNLVDFAKSNPVFVCDGGASVVFVEDAAAGIVAAMERGKAGARYILGGDNLTIRELAELTLELIGKKRKVITLPNGLIRWVASCALKLRIPLPFNPRVVPYATRFWFVDSSRTRAELGVTFRPAREVLAPTVEWLKCAQHIR